MQRLTFFAITGFLLLASPAYAGVGKVSSPEVEKGVAEIEYSGTRYGDSSAASNNLQAHTYELEYGFTDRFMFGIEAESSRSSGEGSQFEGYGIEAQYALTKQGDWWLSSAAKAEYSHAAHHGDADEFEAKLLASYRAGATTLTGNLNFERELGSNRETGIGVGSAFQARYEINEHLSPGFEWHADYGRVNDLGREGENAHYLGPILTGEVAEIGGNELEYTVGYYWGVTGDATDNAARVQLGYEFNL